MTPLARWMFRRMMAAHRRTAACILLGFLLSGCGSAPSSISSGPLPARNNQVSVRHDTVTIQEFSSIATGHTPDGITLGPDGAMWFVEYNVNAQGIDDVVRVASDGQMKKFQYGQGLFPQLFSIVTGPDGALWMTDFDDGLIVRMTTDGNFLTYGIPGVDSYPGDITVGPDGALWFTEIENLSVARITTSGKVTPFHNGISGNPEEIVTGSDGALWFTEPANDLIGRITTGGIVTEYSHGIPAARSRRRSPPDRTVRSGSPSVPRSAGSRRAVS